MKRNNQITNGRTYARAVAAMLILFTTLSHRASAQQWPSDFWHDGKVVLLEGDTLKGIIKYDLQQDLIQFAASATSATAYTARKVLFFEIFDKTVRRYRQFFALPYTTQSGYRAPIFFELLTEGKMTLLARESIEFKSANTGYYYGTNYTIQVLVYKYYFLNEDGKIEEFTGNKNDLLDMMGKKGDDVEKYMKSNRLKFEDKYDFVRIVAYYNSLF